MRMPLGILAPMSLKRFGFLRNSTTSETSSLDSSQPATSLNVTLSLSGERRRARLLPKLIAPRPVARIWRVKRKYSTPTIIRNGSTLDTRFPQNVLDGISFTSHGAVG